MSDNASISGLQFNISADDNGALDSLDRAAQSLGKIAQVSAALKRSLSGLNKVKIDSSVGGAIKSIMTALEAGDANKISAISTALGGLSNARMSSRTANSIATVLWAANNVSPEGPANLEKIADAMQRIATSGSTAAKALGAVSSATKRVRAPKKSGTTDVASKTGESDTDKVEGGQRNTELTAAQKQTIKNLKTIAGAGIRGFQSGFTSSIRNSFQLMANAAKQAASAIQIVIGKVQALGRELISLGVNKIKDIGSQIADRIVAPFEKLKTALRAIGRIAAYRLIRTAIKDLTAGLKAGIGNLYEYSKLINGDFANSMNGLATDAQYLKNSLAAMAAPIINSLAPAIDFIAGKIVSLLNLINQLFAALSGKSVYTVAKKAATEYSGAAKSAGKAAKAAKKSVLAFDELNKLTDKNSSGSGGGSKTPDYSSMFDQAKISDKIKKLADELKQDPEKAGFDVAEMIADALDSIDWGPIKKKANDIGAKVAGFLNGAFKNVHLANSLGQTIGQMLNTGLSLAYGFVHNFDFSQFGVWLGTAWNALVNIFDFDQLEQLISEGGTGVGQALDSFFSTISSSCETLGSGFGKIWNGIFAGIDWSIYADAILQAINDVNLALEGFNTTVDWQGTADNILTAMNTLVDGMIIQNGQLTNVWAENGTQVGVALGGFLDTVNQIINGLHWEELGINIGHWIEGVIAGINPEDFSGIITGLITGLFDVVKGVLETQAIDDLVTAFGTSIKNMIDGFNPDTVAENIGYVVNRIFQIIGEFFDSFDLSDLATKLATCINELFSPDGPVDWNSIDQTIGNVVNDLFGAAADFLDQVDWASVGKRIGGCLDKIDWQQVEDVLTGLARAALEAVGTAIFGTDGGWAALRLIAKIALLKGAISAGGAILSAAGQLAAKSAAGTIIGSITGSGVAGAATSEAATGAAGAADAAAKGAGLINASISSIPTALGAAALAVPTFVAAFDFTDAILEITGLDDVLSDLGGKIYDVTHKGEQDVGDMADTAIQHAQDASKGLYNTEDAINELHNAAQQARLVGGSGNQNLSKSLMDLADALEQKSGESTQTINSVKDTTKSATDQINEATEGMKDTVTSNMDSINQSVSDNMSTADLNAVASVTSMQSDVSDKFGTLFTDTDANFSGIKDSVTQNMSSTSTDAITSASSMHTSVSNDVDTMASDAQDKFADVYQSEKTNMGDATSDLKGLDWTDIGSNLIGGFLKGIKDAWSSVTKWVGDAVDTLNKTVKNGFQIHSPSKLWAGFGRYLDLGLEEGISDNWDSVMNTASKAAAQVNSMMADKASSGITFSTASARRSMQSAIWSEGQTSLDVGDIEQAMINAIEQTRSDGDDNRTYVFTIKMENDEVLARHVEKGKKKLDYRFNPVAEG